MARYKGLASFSANFEPQMAAPLDARSVVDTFDDLLEPVTWQANDGLEYAYAGMLVSVVNDFNPSKNGLYLLLDNNYADPDNWEKINTYVDPEELPSGDTIYTNLEPTVVGVGGIKEGESFSGDTMQEVFNRMFYPTLYPEIVEPSSYWEFVNPDDQYQELHNTGVTFTIRVITDLGSIDPPYETSGLRTPGISKIYFGGSFNHARTWNEDTQEYENFMGSQHTDSLNFERTISYLEKSLNATNGLTTYPTVLMGEQPKDSNGNDYLLPHPLSALSSFSQTVYAVHAYFATTENITELTKQKLKPHDSEYWEVDLVGETDMHKQIIELPSAFGNNMDGIMFYNTISNQWEWLGGKKETSTSTFDITTIVKDRFGTDVNYRRYEHKGSKIGARKLRFIRKP